MTQNDKAVLAALYEGWSEYDGGTYLDFDAVSELAKLSRRDVRLSCRRLRRKGLAKFACGLWDEDGGPAGSGYSISEAGKLEIEAETSDR